MHSDVLEEVAERFKDATPHVHTGNAFDLIRHMTTSIEKRLVHSEAELTAAIEVAETRAKFYEKQGMRYRAMLDFCDWLVATIDAGANLDPAIIRGRAKRVRHAWPTEPDKAEAHLETVPGVVGSVITEQEEAPACAED